MNITTNKNVEMDFLKHGRSLIFISSVFLTYKTKFLIGFYLQSLEYLASLNTLFYQIPAPPQIDAPPQKFLDHVPEVGITELPVNAV